MNIERVGLADHTEREARRRGNARAHKRPYEGVWDFYRGYAGSG